MATNDTDSVFDRLYEERVGMATTDDEVRGYWLFALGLVLGVLGIVLFLPSAPRSGLRQWSIVLGAAGFALLIAGPVIRLPLRRRATVVSYLGLALCGAAIVWFVLAFPDSWSVRTGNQGVIGLYGLGVVVIGLGGVAFPLLTDRADLEAEVGELRAALADAEADEGDLAGVIDRLRGEAADARADEEDLAGQLRSLRASQAQFELYEDRGGEHRWRLRHRNGNIIASSGEGYTQKHNAKKGMSSVRANALGAAVVHADAVTDETGEDALEAVPLLPEVADESQATFEVYEDNAGEHRWRLVHENGNVLADSGEGYASRSGVREAIDSVARNVGPADYLRFDPASFEIYRDNAGEWRWRLVHRNGNILGDSGEGYTRRRDARRAVETVRERAADGEGFEVYADNAGEHRWRLRAANNEIIADCGEGYGAESEAEDAVERVGEYAPDADALDVGHAAFEVYEDEGEEWRWRLRHRNGNVLADGGEGYASRSGVHEAVERVKEHAPGAEIEESD